MAMKEFAKDAVIFEAGQALDRLYLIVRGSVRVTFPGGSYLLKNGDIVGLADINFKETFLKYEAADKTTVVEYAYEPGKVSELLTGNKDAVKYFLASLFHQLDELSSHYKLTRNEYTSLKEYLTGCYEDYKECCKKVSISAGELNGYEELEERNPEEFLPGWITGYYSRLSEIVMGADNSNPDPDFLTGLITKSGRDLREMVSIGDEIEAVKADIHVLLMNEGKTDLFEMYQSLYVKAVKKLGVDDPAVGQIYRQLNDLLLQIETEGLDKEPLYEKRKAQFEEAVKQANELAMNREGNEEQFGKEQLEKIKDSLVTIIKYSEIEEEKGQAFVKSVTEYKNTVGKNGSEDDIRKLRALITKQFNELYLKTFLVAVEDIAVPTVVMMFLNFGYVDEELAGMENAVALYNLAEDLPTSPDSGVYSYFEWLKAIYDCRKDPGRNEFDVDFADYLHEEARNSRITKQQEQTCFKDPVLRVQYELENVFPSVNKTTTGRITTFCPLFSEHNIIKTLDDMLTTDKKVFDIIDEIRGIDYGAYYRQTVFTAPEQGISKEFIDIEVLPDIILAPNIGNRGIMWQEIEGKRRTTPARMFISVFQQEDLRIQLMRLTGQFRWEMCKRVQGARWNDITERSLTSEYFDYVQYFRKNNDLSPEAKDKIKNDMARCKNSFREMFIRDYVIWLQFESQGAPRLNKVARAILFAYVPFSKECRDKLRINPMYKDMIERYETKQKAKIHRLENMKVKITNMGKHLPGEIQAQMDYINA
ncbi:MAG: hypothetical protein K6A38_02025 [Lachnospiraceae bacterium]|nr:hypothetical protein [Lachnospiraceae bacterium]